MLNQHRVGMALGSTLGTLHVAWSILVAIGLAPSLLKIVMMLHFVAEESTINPFRLDLAVILVLVTSTIGYIVGSLFACFWNCAESR